MVDKTLGNILIKRILYPLWNIKRYRIPKIRVEFVDIRSITDRYRDKIDLMKKNFFQLEKQSVGIDGITLQHGHFSFEPADNYGAVRSHTRRNYILVLVFIVL